MEICLFVVNLKDWFLFADLPCSRYRCIRGRRIQSGEGVPDWLLHLDRRGMAPLTADVAADMYQAIELKYISQTLALTLDHCWRV